MSIVIHFEIPADDIDRARNFYSSLFNWDIKDVPGKNNYLLITTGGEKAVSSSLIKRFSPKQTTIIYFDVPSVDEYSAKVQQLGGKVLVSRKAVPGTGRNMPRYGKQHLRHLGREQRCKVKDMKKKQKSPSHEGQGVLGVDKKWG